MKEKEILRYEETSKYKDSERLYQVEFRYKDNSEVFITVMSKSLLEQYLGKEIKNEQEQNSN